MENLIINCNLLWLHSSFSFSWNSKFNYKKISTWRYSLSLMKPVKGEAHPSDRIWTHWRSTSLMETEGRVSASVMASHFRSSEINNSIAVAPCALGRTFYFKKKKNEVNFSVYGSNVWLTWLTSKSTSCWVHSTTVLWLVCTISCGLNGASYGESIPVKSIVPREDKYNIRENNN